VSFTWHVLYMWCHVLYMWCHVCGVHVLYMWWAGALSVLALVEQAERVWGAAPGLLVGLLLGCPFVRLYRYCKRLQAVLSDVSDWTRLLTMSWHAPRKGVAYGWIPVMRCTALLVLAVLTIVGMLAQGPMCGLLAPCTTVWAVCGCGGPSVMESFDQCEACLVTRSCVLLQGAGLGLAA
jgi:hypothetical protein